jgi:3-methyladenine DNA glycosylase AlkC
VPGFDSQSFQRQATRGLQQLQLKQRAAHIARAMAEQLPSDSDTAMPLLELLKDDTELYVRRSVANDPGDLAKDHPDAVFRVCERWLCEANDALHVSIAENRRWLVRHALRYPAKKKLPEALKLRSLAAQSGRDTQD